ncbi:hypothetical protein EVAR_63859_1 [Eumeta japonica]|uniref:Uncharacterized protein n=1 Tax=Eumeta variegata TaxID=151549 RepID=A0A4C1SCJ2_EUMVA|nr:hypothetical protein EVAR_63859_1 [Eumeta japonica]
MKRHHEKALHCFRCLRGVTSKFRLEEIPVGHLIADIMCYFAKNSPPENCFVANSKRSNDIARCLSNSNGQGPPRDLLQFIAADKYHTPLTAVLHT